MKTVQFAMAALAAGTLLAQARLDSAKMRTDLFAGIAGNADALKRMLDASEKLLAENPDHAQALMWHGVATMGSFFQEAQKGNSQQAFPTLFKGSGEMDRAVSLAPDDIEVRVLRAVMYMPASRRMPPQFSEGMLE